MNFKSSMLCFTGLVFAAVTQPALADTVIPRAVEYNNSFIDINDFSGHDPHANISAPGSQSLDNGTSKIESVVSLLPSPSLNLSGSASDGTGGPVGILNVVYNFVVVGPDGLVPVFVAGSGGAGGSSTGHGFFSDLSVVLNVEGPGVSLLNSIAGGGQPGSFTLNNRSEYQANTVYSIHMIAGGAAFSGILGGTANFFANVDPVFTIDPNFAKRQRMFFHF
jgi:hypothetical protein